MVYVLAGYDETTGKVIAHAYETKEDADKKKAGLEAKATEPDKLHLRVVSREVL
jgi:hypothetical protein